MPDDFLSQYIRSITRPTLSNDEDAAIRTVIGEAKGEGRRGWEWVGGVIRNRAKQSGKGFRDVVFAPKQFEPWGSRRRELESYDLNSPEYRDIIDSVLPILRDQVPDPTGGATHFYSPKAQAKLGRKPPSWEDGTGIDVGNHRFFRHGYSGKGLHGIQKGAALSKEDHPFITAFIRDDQLKNRPSPPQPVPESDDTLQLQYASVIDPRSPRVGVLYESGRVPEFDPQVFGVFPVGDRIMLVNYQKARKLGLRGQQHIQNYITKQPDVAIARLTGIPDSANVGQNTAGGLAVKTTVGGNEAISTVAPTPESAVEIINSHQAQFPEGVSQVVPTQQVAEGRMMRPEDVATPRVTPAQPDGQQHLSDDDRASFTNPPPETQEDVDAEFEEYIIKNNLPRNQVTVNLYNADLKRRVDAFNAAMTRLDEGLRDLGDISEASKRGMRYSAYKKQKDEVEAEYQAFALKNNLDPKEQSTADLFRTHAEVYAAQQELQDEQNTLKKYPQYAQFLKDNGLTHSNEAIDNAQSKVQGGGSVRRSRRRQPAVQPSERAPALERPDDTFTDSRILDGEYDEQGNLLGARPLQEIKESEAGNALADTLTVDPQNALRDALGQLQAKYGIDPAKVLREHPSLQLVGVNGHKDKVDVTYDDLANMGVDVAALIRQKIIEKRVENPNVDLSLEGLPIFSDKYEKEEDLRKRFTQEEIESKYDPSSFNFWFDTLTSPFEVASELIAGSPSLDERVEERISALPSGGADYRVTRQYNPENDAPLYMGEAARLGGSFYKGLVVDTFGSFLDTAGIFDLAARRKIFGKDAKFKDIPLLNISKIMKDTHDRGLPEMGGTKLEQFSHGLGQVTGLLLFTAATGGLGVGTKLTSLGARAPKALSPLSEISSAADDIVANMAKKYRVNPQLARMAVIGITQQSSEAFNRARAKGATEDQALLAAVLAAPTGLVEGFSELTLFKKLATIKKLDQATNGKFSTAFMSRIKQYPTVAHKVGKNEFIEEALQGVGTELGAQVYDNRDFKTFMRDMDKAVQDAAIAYPIGATVGLAGQAALDLSMPRMTGGAGRRSSQQSAVSSQPEATFTPTHTIRKKLTDAGYIVPTHTDPEGRPVSVKRDVAETTAVVDDIRNEPIIAAYRLPDGQVITGAAHGDIQVEHPEVLNGGEVGVTIKGRFLSITDLSAAKGDYQTAYNNAANIPPTAAEPTDTTSVEPVEKQEVTAKQPTETLEQEPTDRNRFVIDPPRVKVKADEQQKVPEKRKDVAATPKPPIFDEDGSRRQAENARAEIALRTKKLKEYDPLSPVGRQQISVLTKEIATLKRDLKGYEQAIAYHEEAKAAEKVKEISLPEMTKDISEPAKAEQKVPEKRKDVASAQFEAAPQGIATVRTGELSLDPNRFQYKLNKDASGATGSLKGVSEWNPNFAGLIQVWRDPTNGKTYVVNGHNRFNKALELKQPTVNVQYIDAPNAVEARAVGAKANIASGDGTPLDAAQYFKDSGESPETLKKQGLPLSNDVAKKGIALSNLNDFIFNAVRRGELAEEQGVAIGNKVTDHDLQNQAYKALVKASEKKALTQAVSNEIIDAINSAPRHTETERTLFGDFSREQSLFAERAQGAAALRRRMSEDKSLFGTAARKSERLGEGGTQVDVEQAKALQADAGEALAVFDKLKNKSGEISDILDGNARRIANGERPDVVAKDSYGQIKRAVKEAIGGSVQENDGGISQTSRTSETEVRQPALGEMEETPLRSVSKDEWFKPIATEQGINYEEVQNVTRGVERGEREIRRLGAAGERGRVAGGQRNVEASIVLGASEAKHQAASLGSESRVEQIRRQEDLLTRYARSTGFWLDPKFTDRFKKVGAGGEANVYHQSGSPDVYKVVDYRHINGNTTPLDFLDRLSLFNALFPEATYTLEGVTREDGKLKFVVKQPYVNGGGVSRGQVIEAMKARGLNYAGYDTYDNELYRVHDLHEKNVLQDKDGNVFVIDAVPELKDENRQPFSVEQIVEPLRSSVARVPQVAGGGNLVKGSVFRAALPVFTGSFRNAKFSHNVEVKAEVVKESYGADRGQHTFTIKILESSHPSDFEVGKEYRKKGRNLYPNLKGSVEQGVDYVDIAAEKEQRGLQNKLNKLDSRIARHEEELPLDADGLRLLKNERAALVLQMQHGDILKSVARRETAERSPLGFFSQVEQTILDKMPNKASADQVRGILKDAKKEELDWLDIDSFLAENPTVSKDDLLAYVRAHNADVQEVVRGDRMGIDGISEDQFDRAEYLDPDYSELTDSWRWNVPKELKDDIEYVDISEYNGKEYEINVNGNVIGSASSFRGMMSELSNYLNRYHNVQFNTDDKPAKFSQYTLPGGENYRELLLTLTSVDAGGLREWYERSAGEEGHIPFESLSDAQYDKIAAKWRDVKARQDTNTYKSPHWDEPAVVVHIRFDSRDGGKTLHIAEIQSDWHQAARKKDASGKVVGYNANPKKIAQAEAQVETTRTNLDKVIAKWQAIQEVTPKYDTLYVDGKQVARINSRKEGFGHLLSQIPRDIELSQRDEADLRSLRRNYAEDVTEGRWRMTRQVKPTAREKAVAQRLKEATHAYNQAVDVLNTLKGQVPDAPFKKSWPMLAFKRMLRYAIDNGYERITFDTGETNAERYDLSRYIDVIDVEQDGKFRDVEIQPQTGDAITFSVREDGSIYDVTSYEPRWGALEGKPLSDVIGKELADKILSNEGRQTYAGPDLKVTSPGMVSFYDKILPAEINKYVKRFGGKVTEGRIAGTSDTDFPVHSLEITPAMRRIADEGQPLFAYKKLSGAPTITRDGKIYEQRPVLIEELIKRDPELKEFIKQNNPREGREITEPVIIGEKPKGIVVDGMQRIAQAISNGQRFISAFVEPVEALRSVSPSQKALRSAHIEDILLAQTGGEMKGRNLHLSECDAEVLRRVLGEQHFRRHGKETPQSAFDGAMWSPDQMRGVIDLGNELRKELLDAGYAEDTLKGYDTLYKNLEKLLEANENHVVTYSSGDPKVLEEEETHREDADTGFASEKIIALAKKSPFWNDPEFNKDYGHLSDVKKTAEAIGKLAADRASDYGWDKIPDFEKQQESLLRDWADDKIERNADFIKEHGFEAFADKFRRIARYASHQTSNAGRGTETQGSGSTDTVPERSGDTQGTDTQRQRSADSRQPSEESTGVGSAERSEPVSDRPAEGQKVKTDTRGLTQTEIATQLNRFAKSGDLAAMRRRIANFTPEQKVRLAENLRAGDDPAEAIKDAKDWTTPEYQEGITELNAGFPFLKSLFGEKTRVDTIGGILTDDNPEVEARMSAAEGIKQPGILTKMGRAIADVGRSFKRTYPFLNPNKDAIHAATNDLFRQLDAAPAFAKALAADKIAQITQNLGKNRMKLFSRAIILPDIMKDIEAGLYEGKDLPFGFKNKRELQQSIDKYNELVAETPAVKDAIARRERFNKDLTQRLVDLELLDPKVLDDPRYYHRQVMAHVNDPAWTGTGGMDARLHQKGFQKGRTGGGDFNTRYAEAEFEWAAQALSLIQRKELLDRINRVANIKPDLMRQAALENKDWQNLIPQGYTIWQPRKGNYFYPATSVAERAVDNAINKGMPLSVGDVRKVIALGAKREQWVVPNEVAKTLDHFNPIEPEHPIERIWTTIQNTWKQWVLLNPTRALKYNLNNMSGDLDIAFAYDPKIMGEFKKAAQDLWQYSIKGQGVKGDIEEALKLGVIDSGLSINEIPDINKSGAFKVLTADNPNMLQRGVEKYWEGTKNFTNWRENILRLAAYRYFKKHLERGDVMYGASTKPQIDAITDINEKAAKLSREIVGDYGAVSHAGKWIRRHLIPFYSWIEINTPRYARMLRNLPHEEVAGRNTNVTGRIALATGKKVAFSGVKFAIKVNLLLLLAAAFNRLVFPDEEKELRRTREGRTGHLILGRRADGSIRTIRIAGALADALEWFGKEDYPSDIADLYSGKATWQDQAAEAVKAPAEKVINAWEPVSKSVFELALGKSAYPHIFRRKSDFSIAAKPIRDRGEYVARLFSLDGLYRRVTGRPRPPSDSSPLGVFLDWTVAYRIDPKEAAYWNARGNVMEWAKKRGKQFGSGEPTDRSNALYYYKMALKWGDKKAAERYLQEYRELGGTDRGLKTSERKSHPLAGIARKEWSKYKQSLTQDQKEELDTAIEFYTQMYRPSKEEDVDED